MSSTSAATTKQESAVVQQLDAIAEEMIAFLQGLVRIPTVNPPGEEYTAGAEFIGGKLKDFGYETQYVAAEGLAEHTVKHPRVNVIGRAPGRPSRPLLHFNGHFDVVPVGQGWTVDPFGAVLRDGKLYGRGTCDQKAGIAASIYAVEAIRRSGVNLGGTVEQSGTVDEESGGFAGVAYLAERGFIHKDKTSFVIITEPSNVDRIMIGHRGVYWFKVVQHGRIAHGSMPYLGVNAADHLGDVISDVNHSLKPEDRRFLPEERFERVREEVRELLEKRRESDASFQYSIEDLMIVHPTQTNPGSNLVTTVARSIEDVLGVKPPLTASPGTYDQKHVTRIGHVEDCIAYGPGILDLAHQPDEYVAIDDLVNAAKVMALTTMRLLGTE
jgi:succinyl-diaminopimelate desuccinylase